MSSFFPIIQSFIGGVLTRKGWGSVASKAYADGLEYCVNWVISIQGSIRKRAGAEFAIQYDGSSAVVKTLSEKDDNDIICTFINDKLYLSNTKGPIKSTPNLVKNGDFSNNMKGWTIDTARSLAAFPTDVSPSGDRLLMSASSNCVVKSTPFGRTLQIAASTKELSDGGIRWARVFQAVPISNGGTAHKLTLDLRTSLHLFNKRHKVQFNVRVGAAKYGYELVNRKITIQPPNASLTYVSGNQKIDITFTPPPLTTLVYLMFEVVLLIQDPVVDPAHGAVLTSDNGAVLSLNNIIMYDSTAGTDVVLTTPYNDTMLDEIQTVSDSGKSSMWISHNDFFPQVVRRNPSTNVWEIIPAPITVPPASWAAGNYPACVCIYQSRLYFAATRLDPSQIWGSAVGNYNDFLITGTGNNIPLQFILATPATIRWMMAAKTLLIGTDNSEWLLTSSTGIITPSDFQFQMQSAYGCSSQQPVLSGMGVLYASNTNRKLRYIQDGGSNSYAWVSQDIFAQAENITGGTIVDVVFILEPDYQIYMLVSSGVIARCTFSTDNGVCAWALYVDALGGRINSITGVNTPAGQYLYMAIERGYAPDKTFLERTNPHEIFEVLLDSYGLFNVQTEGGISRLPDKTGNDWSVLGQGINGAGDCVDYFGDNVYVGGAFDVAGGLVNTAHIARWDNAANTWHAMGTGANDVVNCILTNKSTGVVYAGGVFTLAGGVANTSKVAMFDGAWHALGLGFDNTVLCLARSVGGQLYAGGIFTKSGAVDVISIAKFNTGTSLWEPVGGNKITGDVKGMVVLSDNRLIAVGDFSIYVSVPTVNTGVAYSSGNLLDLGLAGTYTVFDSFYDAVNNRIYAFGQFGLPAATPIGAGYWDVAAGNWVSPYGSSSTINPLRIFSCGAASGAGDLYVGVLSIESVSVTGPRVLKFWDTVNLRFNYPEQLGHIGVPTNGNVLTITADPTDPNGIYFGGEFTSAQGYGGMGRVCYYNKTLKSYARLGGTPSLGSGSNGGLNGIVRMLRAAPALPLADPAKFFYRGQIIAVGDFTFSAAGVAIGCRGVARYDKASNKWLAVGSGLAGGLNAVNCVCFDDGGRIYAGGSFINVGDPSSNIDRIAVFDPDLSTSIWYPVGSGIDDGAVTAITFNNGKLYVSGTFTRIGGVPYAGHAVFDLFLQVWVKPDLGFSSSPAGQSFLTISFDAAGKEYGFGNFSGITYASSDMAIYDPVGDTWTAMGEGLVNGHANCVYAATIGGNEVVLIGGLFDAAIGIPNTKNLVGFLPSTNQLQPSYPTNGEVLSIRSGDDPVGNILVIGDFSTIGYVGSETAASGMVMISVFGLFAIATGDNARIIVDGVFNDDGVLFALGDFASSGRYIEDLDRLESQTVTVLSINPVTDQEDLLISDPTNFARRSVFDGYYIREWDTKPVVTLGRIPVPDWVGDSAYVGLSYTAEFKTLPLEGGEPAGTSQGGSNRWSKVFVRLNESNLPLIRNAAGSSMGFPNAYQPQLTKDSEIPVWGDPTQAFVSGDYDVSSVGFEQQAAIIVSAPMSIRTEVVGIFGKAITSKL